MYDSADITQAAGTLRRWLLLIHQIPAKPDYFRVKVRRRLQRIGAVALKSSVYVLPHTDEAMEDFQWLRRMVADEGGEATLCAASFVEGVDDREVESMFREQSDAEYGEIIEAARGAASEPSEADVRRLRNQLESAAAHDFFDAPLAEAAVRAVREVEGALTRRREAPVPRPAAPDPDRPRGATWVTRIGVQVDRMASAWLIRRFVDDGALFKFVPAEGYEPGPGELRFDMFEGEFTHTGDSCTFEVLVARFASGDAALHAIGEIVHDIDCKDEKFGRGEVMGVAAAIRGIALEHADDAARVEAAAALFDGLYAAFRRRSA